MDPNANYINSYSSKTLVGSWMDERQIEQDRIDDFLERCRRGDLALQKVTKLYQTLMEEGNYKLEWCHCLSKVGLSRQPYWGPKGHSHERPGTELNGGHIIVLDPTPVKMSTDGCVRFGDSYGLICPPSQDHLVQLGHSLARPRTMLSADCENSLTSGTALIIDGTEITASVCIKARARSVFQVISPQCLPDGSVVKYGMPIQFRLANQSVSKTPLYLASEQTSIVSSSRMARHQKLFLNENEKSYNTYWKIEYLDPRYRLEMECCPVKSDTIVLIKHCQTNAAIAVEDRFFRNLSFGQEYEASCHTYLDRNQVEMDVNWFSLATVIPPNDQ